MIPKIFHRIWFGDRSRPVAYDVNWSNAQRIHPEWEFITWTEDTLPPLRNQDIYERQAYEGQSLVNMDRNRLTAVARADLVAYELLCLHGGVYINCDIEVLKPFDDLLNYNAFAGREDDMWVCNAVMGTHPGDALMDACIQAIPGRFSRDNLMESATGPRLLTEMYNTRQFNIHILPVEAFYPISHWDVPVGGDASFGTEQAIEQGSYAIHHWAHQYQEGDLNG
ncbi:MAG: hypothetical protein LC723_07585 [Actinobacteria bacterium]|nr:hypothetical protein [Actinomycetota bacterium]